ncbi:hypothetical protein DPMN_062284 [Dreissena polymorpha]|uniref:Uncharacterized protein n=1 Tax=Dreissena polymorpha TaxID=45954 RepID=A0A9D4HJ67_DREPO|nr:hypothetical protein DPMN_062284 [Dreissena polymorpha]
MEITTTGLLQGNTVIFSLGVRVQNAMRQLSELPFPSYLGIQQTQKKVYTIISQPQKVTMATKRRNQSRTREIRHKRLGETENTHSVQNNNVFAVER